MVRYGQVGVPVPIQVGCGDGPGTRPRTIVHFYGKGSAPSQHLRSKLPHHWLNQRIPRRTSNPGRHRHAHLLPHVEGLARRKGGGLGTAIVGVGAAQLAGVATMHGKGVGVDGGRVHVYPEGDGDGRIQRHVHGVLGGVD